MGSHQAVKDIQNEQRDQKRFDPLAEEDDDYFIPQASIHFGKRCLYLQSANLALLCAGLMIDRVLAGDVLWLPERPQTQFQWVADLLLNLADRYRMDIGQVRYALQLDL